MRFRFVTEGGRSIGLGHYLRCSSLAYAALELGHEVTFTIYDPDSIALPAAPWPVSRVSTVWSGDTAIDLKSTDVAVVDSYQAPLSFYQSVRREANTCMWLDDDSRLAYPDGTILNGNPLAKPADYPGVNPKQLMLGPQWQPLRPAFWDVPAREVRQAVGTCFVCFGGSDATGMLPVLLPRLMDAFPTWKFTVAAGSSVEVPPGRCEVVRDASDAAMVQMMHEADLAVSAAGQTSYELARCGLASVLVAVAENQAGNMEAWRRSGLCLQEHRWTDENLAEDVSEDARVCSLYPNRVAAARVGVETVDGHGARRVVRALAGSTSNAS